MDSKKQITDKLKKRAAQIAWHIARRTILNGTSSRWRNYTGIGQLEVEYLTDGLRFWQRGDDKNKMCIVFRGISPKEITKTISHEPIITGSTISDVSTTKVRNESHRVDLSREYVTAFEESRSVDETAGTEITTHITQTISYGGDASPVSGSTEFGLSVTGSFSRAVGTSSSKGRNITTGVDVPPRTECTIVTERSISNYEQELEFWCELDHTIQIYSHRNFDLKFTSMGHMMEYLSGQGSANGAGDLGKFAPIARRLGWTREAGDQLISQATLSSISAPINSHFVTTTRFDKATTGNVIVSDKEIK